MAYNIPVSVSSSAGSGVESPFEDDTYIVFSGSSLESYQPVSNTPSQSTSATATASEGTATSNSNTAAGGQASPANQSPASVSATAGGLSTMDYVLLAAAGLAVFLILHKHLK